VRLDTGEHHEVVRSALEAQDAELVLRPRDRPLLGVVDLHLRPLLGEVEERVGIDRGDDRRRVLVDQLGAGVGGHAGSVEPAAQREHHDRVAQRREVVERRGEHLGDVHPRASTT
jgi:hypothetical protein